MKKMKITLSESDCQEVQEGRVFDWDWKTECGETIKVIIGMGGCCCHCGDEFLPEDMVDEECHKCKREMDIEQQELDNRGE